MVDLEKAYDMVDREQLLQTLASWLGDTELNMLRATLVSLQVRTRGDPSGCTGILTRGRPTRHPVLPCILMRTPIIFPAKRDDEQISKR